MVTRAMAVHGMGASSRKGAALVANMSLVGRVGSVVPASRAFGGRHSSATIRRLSAEAGSGAGKAAKKSSSRRWPWVVAGLVGAGGVAAVYFRRLAKNKAVSPEEFHAPQAEAIAELLADKKALDASKVTLFAYSACPFSGKVRAFLTYHSIPFNEVEVEPMFKSEIADVPYSKVPQLTLARNGLQARLVDSDAIVNYLAPLVLSAPELHALNNDPDVLKWREWTSQHLVRLIVVYINQSLASAVAGYDYIERFDAIPWYNKLFLKVVGAPVMFLVSKFVTRSRLAKLGYTDDQLDSVSTLHAEIDAFVSQGLAGRDFHGGDAPDIVDLEIYGVIHAMQGHAVHDGLLTHTGIGAWLARMEALFTARAALALQA